MNLTSLSHVRRLLDQMAFCPSKALGQNFLVDRHILDLVLAEADPGPRDGLLEIGPGLGVVTEGLAARAGRVVAVEKDARLCGWLEGRFSSAESVVLIHADILDLDMEGLLGGDIPASGSREERGGGRSWPAAAPRRLNKVVSNLPYACGTRILMDLVAVEGPPEDMVVMVQKEVADRLAASPGSPEYGMSSVWAQLVYDVKKVKTVSPSCFWPKPDVRSALVRLRRRGGAPASREVRRRVYALTRAAFEHRRKQLAGMCERGVLRGLSGRACREALEALGAPAKARAEDLGAEQWRGLALAAGPGAEQPGALKIRSAAGFPGVCKKV